MSDVDRVIRYAIYTRQSVEKLDDLTSCQVQFQTCKDFAETEGASNACWIGEHFDDQGYSGMNLDRPGMTRLRELVQARRIDVVYAVALDRLSRRMRDTVMLLDELDRAGVKLRLVYQSELTSNAEGRFLRHVLAAFAEFERDMIATRIADSRAYLKRHGRRLAGKVPYATSTGWWYPAICLRSQSRSVQISMAHLPCFSNRRRTTTYWLTGPMSLNDFEGTGIRQRLSTEAPGRIAVATRLWCTRVSPMHNKPNLRIYADHQTGSISQQYQSLVELARVAIAMHDWQAAADALHVAERVSYSSGLYGEDAECRKAISSLKQGRDPGDACLTGRLVRPIPHT